MSGSPLKQGLIRKCGLVTLVGVHHEAPVSQEIVRMVFESMEPDVVCLELCEERFNRMVTGKRAWPGFRILGARKLCSRGVRVMRDSIEGYKSGSEFITAHDLALAAGVPTVNIDIDGERIRAADGHNLLSAAIKLIMLGAFYPLLYLLIRVKRLPGFRCYHRAAMRVVMWLWKLIVGVESLCSALPDMSVLQEERDAHMSGNLIELANNGFKKIMAIVGRNHLDGIERELERLG